jgi:hypothetical protein
MPRCPGRGRRQATCIALSHKQVGGPALLLLGLELLGFRVQLGAVAANLVDELLALVARNSVFPSEVADLVRLFC